MKPLVVFLSLTIDRRPPANSAAGAEHFARLLREPSCQIRDLSLAHANLGDTGGASAGVLSSSQWQHGRWRSSIRMHTLLALL